MPNIALANPWRRLPSTPPYVLQEDAEFIHAFNESAPEGWRYDLSLIPEPFNGSPTAPVVLLGLNPGWSRGDAEVHENASFLRTSMQVLAHEAVEYPFTHLQPDDWLGAGQPSPGQNWWRKKVRQLFGVASSEVLARQLLCVEFFPYHSKTFGFRSPAVPSQNYGFQLVRDAMARDAEIVIMRSKRLWFGAVPDLESYSHLHLIRNPRNPAISEPNLGRGFEVIANRLELGR